MRSPVRVAVGLVGGCVVSLAAIALVWRGAAPVWVWAVALILGFSGLLIGVVALVVRMTERLMGADEDRS